VETAQQRLPPGITPLPLQRHLAGVCDACGTEAEYDGDWLVECDKCRCVPALGWLGVWLVGAGLVGEGGEGVQGRPVIGWLCVCVTPVSERGYHRLHINTYTNTNTNTPHQQPTHHTPRLLIHMGCYGVKQHPAGAPWLCDVCALPGVEHPPPCVLCPRVGGAMKPTRDGRWCHLLCATWVPGVAVADEST